MTITLTEYKDAAKEALKDTYPKVYWHVGIDDPPVPGAFVWFNLALGPGLATEWITDVRGVEVTVAGDQRDYAGAEELAFAVDHWLLGDGGSRVVAGMRVINVTRSGGAPYPLSFDNANRTRFVCGYLYEVYSGIGTPP
jgi:hypothetical protein